MKNYFLLLLIGFFACLSPSIFGQATNKAEVRRIDAYCKSIDAITKDGKGPKLVFADTSGESDKKERWRKFASEKALEKFRERSETYTVAYVWRNRGKVAMTNFTLFSGSGDWAKYVLSYYRLDGSLARVKSELRTFYGNYIVIQRRYFDKAGKLVRKTAKYLDLKTEKPRKPDPEYIEGNSGWNDGDYFMRTSTLPFAKLLQRK